MLNSKVNGFKNILADSFDEHCRSGSFSLKTHLVEHIVNVLRRFDMLFVSHASPCDLYNLPLGHHIVQSCPCKRMKQTVQGLQLCLKGDERCLSSIEKVNSAAKWKDQDLQSCFRFDGRHLSRDDEKFSQQDILFHIDLVYIGNMENAGLFSHLLSTFKDDALNTFCSLHSEIAHP